MSRIPFPNTGAAQPPDCPTHCRVCEMTAQDEASGAVWVTGPGSSALCLGLFRELV